MEFIGISVILPSPSVSSFFIKASHFFLLMAWLILPSSAVVMKPELSLSIACRHGEFFYQRETSSLHTHLECEDGSVEVLRLSLLINVFLQHLRSPNSQSEGDKTQADCLYLFAKLRKASFSMNPDSFVILFNLNIKIHRYLSLPAFIGNNNAISAIKSSGQVVH